jgi:acetyltransferase-like isoleucine patch superfamily enzyme
MWLVGLLTNWWPDNRISLRLRCLLARPFLKRCGKNFQLGSHVTLLNPGNMEIGDNVYIAHGAWLNAMGHLTIEDEVIIAPYVTISTLQHVFKDGSVRFGGSIAQPVRVGRGSWLAAHVSVKCGITIGSGCLVAANSAVVKDLPDGVLAGGVPAKVIGPNEDGEATFQDRFEMKQGVKETRTPEESKVNG